MRENDIHKNKSEQFKMKIAKHLKIKITTLDQQRQFTYTCT